MGKIVRDGSGVDSCIALATKVLALVTAANLNYAETQAALYMATVLLNVTMPANGGVAAASDSGLAAA